MPARLDALSQRRLSRRAFAGGGAAALAAPALLRSPRSASAQEQTSLDFVIWNYAEDIVQDNINIFQEQFPNVSVTLSSFTWQAYHETMVNRFRSKTPTDVAYNGGNWLEEFAAAGWVVPLEDHFSWVRDYETKVQPFAWQDMTYNGKVYGLPYYADTITFMYNEKALTDAGISAPPQTWEEVTEQCLTLKAAGMEFPFIYEFANTLPNVSEAFASMVFGRGGELIDEEKNPLWTDPNSPAALQLKWLVDAKNTDQILTIQPHEVDVANAMNTGQHAFTVMFNYNLAALNNAATSPLAGQFQLGLMPGETHECYGFAKFYNMTQMAVDRGQETIDAVGSFIQYFEVADEPLAAEDGRLPSARLAHAVGHGRGEGDDVAGVDHVALPRRDRDLVDRAVAGDDQRAGAAALEHEQPLAAEEGFGAAPLALDRDIGVACDVAAGLDDDLVTGQIERQDIARELRRQRHLAALIGMERVLKERLAAEQGSAQRLHDAAGRLRLDADSAAHRHHRPALGPHRFAGAEHHAAEAVGRLIQNLGLHGRCCLSCLVTNRRVQAYRSPCRETRRTWLREALAQAK